MTPAELRHLIGGMILEDGRTFAAAAYPFQWEFIDAVLAETGPRYHLTIRPRGASKTSDSAAVAIALLLDAPAGARSYAVAGDVDQGGLLLDAVRGLVARTELGGVLRVEARKVTAASGATLEVLAADGPSTYGLRPWFVIADEVAVWPSTTNAKTVWEAVLSSLPKTPGARFVALSSAGDPAHWFFKVRTHAVASPAWSLHEVAGPCPWINPEALVEQRGLLTDSAYRRLHLGEWCEPEGRLSTVADVRACVRHSGVLEARRGTRYVVGVDIGVTNDRTAIAVCHADPGADGPTVVCDRIALFVPTKGKPIDLHEVEEMVFLLAGEYRAAKVVCDPYQAVLMISNLRRRGLKVEPFTFSQATIGRLAVNLYRLLRDRRLALPDDERLLDELARVRLVETAPNVIRLDHASGEHDDQTIALSLAALELAGESQSGPASVTRATGGPIARPKSGARAMPKRTVTLMFGNGSSATVGHGSVHDHLRRFGR
jgi:phage terminase large subunit-like protein